MASVPLSRCPIGRWDVSPSYPVYSEMSSDAMESTALQLRTARKDSPAGPKKNETWEFAFFCGRISEGGWPWALL